MKPHELAERNQAYAVDYIRRLVEAPRCHERLEDILDPRNDDDVPGWAAPTYSEFTALYSILVGAEYEEPIPLEEDN